MKMRIIHRYLGFFLAGIMAVYAISGIVLIFRDSDTFKNEVIETRELEPGLTELALEEALNIKRFEVTASDEQSITYAQGSYDRVTGIANITSKKLPFILDKMTHLHKAKSGQPLFFLNIFFGLGLLFFVISSFWMFIPQSNVFKKGMYYTAGGIVLTLVLLFV
jgi:hypothetical protein